MKKSLFNKRGGNILLGICCLLLAILFWFAVEYTSIESIPLLGFIFS